MQVNDTSASYDLTQIKFNPNEQETNSTSLFNEKTGEQSSSVQNQLPLCGDLKSMSFPQLMDQKKLLLSMVQGENVPAEMKSMIFMQLQLINNEIQNRLYTGNNPFNPINLNPLAIFGNIFAIPPSFFFNPTMQNMLGGFNPYQELYR